jgi:hypothetical protein
VGQGSARESNPKRASALLKGENGTTPAKTLRIHGAVD